MRRCAWLTGIDRDALHAPVCKQAGVTCGASMWSLEGPGGFTTTFWLSFTCYNSRTSEIISFSRTCYDCCQHCTFPLERFQPLALLYEVSQYPGSSYSALAAHADIIVLCCCCRTSQCGSMAAAFCGASASSPQRAGCRRGGRDACYGLSACASLSAAFAKLAGRFM
jgi:hypothetical protein